MKIRHDTKVLMKMCVSLVIILIGNSTVMVSFLKWLITPI